MKNYDSEMGKAKFPNPQGGFEQPVLLTENLAAPRSQRNIEGRRRCSSMKSFFTGSLQSDQSSIWFLLPGT